MEPDAITADEGVPTAVERAVQRRERERDESGRPSNARPRDRFGRPLPRGTVPEETVLEIEVDDAEEALPIAVWLWDEERFFEAHELLETVWHAAPQDDRLFWQGVIQVAVGCCHHQRGNLAGAVGLFRRAEEKLADYPDVHHGVDVEQLRVAASGAADALEQAGAVIEVAYPRFPAMDDGPWVTPPSQREGTSEEDLA